jgi:hypothetical protein
MGLFGNEEARELNQLLDAIQGSTLRDIDAIRSGDPPPLSDLEAKGGVFAEMTLNNRITRAAELAKRMSAKGKGSEAEAIRAGFQAKPVPVSVFGGGPEAIVELEKLEELRGMNESELPPIKGSGTAAQAEERRRDELRRMWANDAHWQLAIEEIRERAGISRPGARR